MKKLITWKLIACLLIGPIVGLLLCHFVEFFVFSGNQHIDQTSIGRVILQVLAGIFGMTAVVLVPLRVFWDRHEVRDTAKYLAERGFDPEVLPPVQRHLFYMHFGSIPKWVYFPFVIAAIVLAGVFALGIISFVVLGLVWLALRAYMHFFGG